MPQKRQPPWCRGTMATTYGGNPLVCAAANAVLDVFEEKNIVGHVQEIGAYLWEKLEEIVAEYDCVIAHRGKGLIQGLEFNTVVGPVVSNALMEQHLVLISAEQTSSVSFLRLSLRRQMWMRWL